MKKIKLGLVGAGRMGQLAHLSNYAVLDDCEVIALAEPREKLAQKVDQLRSCGVADVIIDPGFGFGKTIDHNFQLLHDLEQFRMFERPLLVGVSRKSMIYKYKGGGPEDALNGTSVLNTLALTKGANILRVHDVKEAVECVKLVTKTGV